MNDETALPGRPATNSTYSKDIRPDRLQPGLRIDLRLEELPTVRVIASSWEDAQRLRSWLRRADRRRIHEALDEELDAAA